ncbi:MAG: endonuclease/exonuclease/phosphatase family protein [Alphaproteobacteria bacterium]
MLFVSAAGCDGDDDDSSSAGQADDDSANGGTDDDALDDDAVDDDQADDDLIDDDAVDDDVVDDDAVDDDAVDDDTADDDTAVTWDPDEPLCAEWQANPEDLDDPVNIHCLIERGDFAPPPERESEVLRVVDWNIERGHHIDDYIYYFQNDPTLSGADIILIQEADRHCERTDYRHVTRELAEALEMNYAYVVEFVELNQDRGEHGNAILTRFPIVGVKQLRHTDFERWYEDPGQLRLGGRITLRAKILVGEQRVQLASVHYTSGVQWYFQAHQTQTQETLDLLAPFAEPTIWGGDLNTGIYWVLRFEPSINLILNSGYDDALAHLPHSENWTMPEDPPIPRMRLDWIFHRGLTVDGGRVLYEEPLNGLSDHMGIFADLIL